MADKPSEKTGEVPTPRRRAIERPLAQRLANATGTAFEIRNRDYRERVEPENIDTLIARSSLGDPSEPTAAEMKHVGKLLDELEEAAPDLVTLLEAFQERCAEEADKEHQAARRRSEPGSPAKWSAKHIRAIDIPTWLAARKPAKGAR